jgi:hypothetical protein
MMLIVMLMTMQTVIVQNEKAFTILKLRYPRRPWVARVFSFRSGSVIALSRIERNVVGRPASPILRTTLLAVEQSRAYMANNNHWNCAEKLQPPKSLLGIYARISTAQILAPDSRPGTICQKVELLGAALDSDLIQDISIRVALRH